ncbi:MAG: CapA family protein, partial [Oscillospiraceae bacterium]|nr:CapA family protein [Oscillospiraceae bacterium]
MAEKLKSPDNFSVAAKDGAVLADWKPVFGAEGYKLYFYYADDPNTCIKTCFSQKPSKMVTGLENGKQYLVQVCTFYYERNKEVCGELSQKLPFVPFCDSLKARPLSLKVGGRAKLECAYNGSLSSLTYISEDKSVAEVSADGIVTARSAGTCRIKVAAPDGQVFRARVIVDRDRSFAENKAVLMFTGDIMCTAVQQKAAEGSLYDFRAAFDPIRDTLAEADFCAGTLDPVCFDEYPYEHEQQRVNGSAITANAPSGIITAAALAGFDGLATATDNCLNLGQDGLDATVRAVRNAGVKNLGTMGDNPVLADVRGIKVGLITCTMLSGRGEESSMFNFNAKYDRDYFVELVNRAKGMGAEFIVALVHWGRADSGRITRTQADEAMFMAESGAGLIVGCHSHIVQPFVYINTEDGRRAACAYSLGNFLSGMNSMREHSDGAILRVELSRSGEDIRAEYSYIPCSSEDGLRVVRTIPAFNENAVASAERVKKNLLRNIKLYTAKSKVMILGSSILYKILSAGNGFSVDAAGMYLSALSLGSEKFYDVPEGADRILALDITKDIKGCVERSSPDFVAVDFYTAGSVSIYKGVSASGEKIFYHSNTRRMRECELYEKKRDVWARIRPPFGESIWKPLIRSFAQKLLSVVPHQKIIMFRCNISSSRVKGMQLRTVRENERRNRFIREMEDYFIQLVDPAVVDLARNYFVEEGTQITFEPDFYYDSYRAAKEIASGRGRTCIDAVDDNTKFERVIKYYDSMSLRSYHKRLLNMDNAADKIIAQTSAEFAARNRDRLIRLKKSGNCDITFVPMFFKGDGGAAELVRAAEIINAVEKGNLTHPYDFYAPAFNERFNIVKAIARQLSREYGVAVNEESAELMFLLRGKPQLKRYISEMYQFVVDIWGSSVSREAVNRCRGSFINKYVTMQPSLLSHEKPIEYEFSEGAEEFCGSRWRRNILRDAFRKNGVEQLETSEAPWLIVDFYDLICTMMEYHGSLFEVDDFIRRTEFYKKVKADGGAECYLFEKRDMKYCFEQITNFSNSVQDLYGENIILIKADPKKVCINSDYRLEDMNNEDMFEFKRKFISLCEERFTAVTKCSVIDISKSFYSSDSYPLGGRGIVNYEDEFYRQAGEYIREI